MQLLSQIDRPDDLRNLSTGELERLASEIRAFLIDHITSTGGHLGPNLGVVELTLALHRIFDSPQDKIVWDTGHQCYVHKMITGRRRDFPTLRAQGGLSGYPSQQESPHDIVENSHASTSLAYADGLSKAYSLCGEGDRSVVAVIGDGALTGGMAWEALNNIAASDDARRLIIVVNDNGRSYSPTIGGLAKHLAALRTRPTYERLLSAGRELLHQTPIVGGPIYGAMHGMKKGLKDALAPQALFEDLGIKYVGPIDGHDVAELEESLRLAKSFGRPIIVHCVTQKGRGYGPAEQDDEDCFHAIGKLDAVSGKPNSSATSPASWTSAFGAELARLGAERPDIVAITAAMLHPVGLTEFEQSFPERTIDVGIAEQHAVTSAAGLAMGGMHPVVALYATFLNRGFDQLLMDVALHRCGVTFVLDRAGITGSDGPSHNGIWDMSLLQIVPDLRLAAPRDAATLREALRDAVEIEDRPTVVRFPKGSIEREVPALDRLDGIDILHRHARSDVLIVGVGALAGMCVRAAELLAAQGIGATVIDPRWVKPIPEALLTLALPHRMIVTVEDNGRVGGVGSVVAQALRDAHQHKTVHVLGIPQRFIAQGSRAEILAEIGLTETGLYHYISQLLEYPRDVSLSAPGAAVWP
ncbi:1-deoxy-D-xylulose-5-phosphate synthase [Nocardia colli]|uniref:1-deoxy-D-xylulose-5-phosphate synthase n=1 Tax=Nocardia colli TaxID=2545717 RepID=A0A5N0ECB4_9NOCA|nr:1-deoxy-D-xylulose-5-phosphate synthase [Nocardia colli]KAA8887072.1 1-deoxy-D-xylulose-5-phosphate synthase [Nocardia colli]